jgi:hypothetical protein
MSLRHSRVNAHVSHLFCRFPLPNGYSQTSGISTSPATLALLRKTSHGPAASTQEATLQALGGINLSPFAVAEEHPLQSTGRPITPPAQQASPCRRRRSGERLGVGRRGEVGGPSRRTRPMRTTRWLAAAGTGLGLLPPRALHTAVDRVAAGGGGVYAPLCAYFAMTVALVAQSARLACEAVVTARRWGRGCLGSSWAYVTDAQRTPRPGIVFMRGGKRL